MTNQTKTQSLSEFTVRVSQVVTELNGLISSIVNEEVTAADFDDLAELFERLATVDRAVTELVDLFWREPMKKTYNDEEEHSAVRMD